VDVGHSKQSNTNKSQHIYVRQILHIACRSTLPVLHDRTALSAFGGRRPSCGTLSLASKSA